MLKGLLAVGAVEDCAAESWAKRVLHPSVAAVAERAGDDRVESEWEQVVAKGGSGCDRRRITGGAQILAAPLGNAVAGPLFAVSDADIDLGRDPAQPLAHVVAHDADGGAANESRHDLDSNPIAI